MMDTADTGFVPLLEQVAVHSRPRLFAIYGSYKRDPTEPLLGWGMEFAAGGAVFHALDDGSTHLSETAQDVLEVQSVIGDVRLTWLDG
ncbi:hypothetical protein FB471_3690 [Amycolatopsis cihanbeyliensis]|uniref:Uncharacterized protein n=2 Tax=Amycolatopsis cihanbeyliensis TaxID=1128664 RepID=A0A542DLE4_AMYCI|nr:hypothetical protein FB471_3690 [Amycolatopsis cihanbeyliensis]